MTADPLSGLHGTFSGRLFTDPEEMAPFLVDWRGLWRGDALAVVQPDNAADVAAVMRWASSTNTAVTPQGGNTGLSGGSVPEAGSRGIVLSLARLNRIRSVDPVNNSMTVEAGCVLAQVQAAADEADRLFPLSLAAEGSCTIGGNLAANAGGTGVLRYGNARELCLGLEVVTATGEIWDGLRGLRKDNTGYSLRDLFVGSEGTLGIITAAVLKLYPRPVSRMAAFASLVSPHEALAVLTMLQAKTGDGLTGFELMSDVCLELVREHIPTARIPVETGSSWYILIEVSDLVSEDRATAALQDALMAAYEAGHLVDVAFASSLAQTRDFWALRENISEAQSAAGKTIKHDIAVPLSEIARFIDQASAAVVARYPDARLVIFGHMGDGNLHFNISPALGEDPAQFLARQNDLNRIVHDLVAATGGSISAEHGLGVLRMDEAARYKSKVEMALMQSIKRALDPTGIMNPGKVLQPDFQNTGW